MSKGVKRRPPNVAILKFVPPVGFLLGIMLAVRTIFMSVVEADVTADMTADMDAREVT